MMTTVKTRKGNLYSVFTVPRCVYFPTVEAMVVLGACTPASAVLVTN